MPDWSRFADDYADHEDRLQGERQRLLTTLEYYLALPLIEWVDYLTEDERQRFVHPNIGYISSLESNRC